MLKIIFTIFTFSLLFLTPFSSFAAYKNFKPIGTSPKFAPPAYSAYATANRTIKGGVSIGGRFAMATLNPKNAVALGRQIARSNPYALVGLAALSYFQDEDNDWYKSADKEGEMPVYPPESDDEYYYICEGQEVIEEVCMGILAAGHNAEENKRNASCSVTQTNNPSPTTKGIYPKCVYEYLQNPDTDTWGSTFHYRGWLNGALETNITCPPEANPDATASQDADSDGVTDGCYTVQDYQDYTPKAATTAAMATALGDQMFQTNQELTSWEPFKDYPDDDFLSPNYVSDYNQPDVSDTFNEYLKDVAADNYQSSDANAPNYVPADMVAPTQAAIKGLEKGDPIVDPVTNEIADSNISTDGAAAAVPDPNAQPVTISGSITVNVPEDDTISQTEYETSNAKFFQEFADGSTNFQANNETMVSEAQQGDIDFIDSLGSDVSDFSAFPDFPLISALWSPSGGGCIPYTSEASIAGNSRVITYDKHCPFYTSVAHPLLVWFLYISTALYVIHLAGRTFKSTTS